MWRSCTYDARTIMEASAHGLVKHRVRPRADGGHDDPANVARLDDPGER
jgi:hypothetical protein